MPATLAPGTVIGGEFLIERPLGQGGMGTVYLARQRSTNRLRALKLLSSAVVSDPRSRERFSREAMAASLIESEHVVEVIAAGIDETLGSAPWIAMEYLEGEELTDHVAGQPDRVLPRQHAFLVLEQVFHALAAAHRVGVVHRDIKPENVFLARARMVGIPFVVKVLDFGIAKVLTETRPASQTTSIGTPGWMAPEQLERGIVTPAADVWALGLLAYFVLTGTRFWARENQENVSLQMLLFEMVMAPIPPASVRAAEYGRAQLLPAGFDDWLGMCLVRNPEGRFADAGAAWQALARLVHGAPVRDCAVRADAIVPPTILGEPAQAAMRVPSPQPGAASLALEGATQPWTPRGAPVLAAPVDIRGSLPDVAVPPPVFGPGATVAGPGGTVAGPGGTVTADGGWSPGKTQSASTGELAQAVPVRRFSRAKLAAVLVAGLAALGGFTTATIVLATRSSDPAKAPVFSATAQQASAPASSSAPAQPADMIGLPGASLTIDGKAAHVNYVEVDRTEVSVAAWQSCVDAGKCEADVASVSVAGAESWSVLCNWPRRVERAQYPMNCVSRDQAEAFCKSKGKRLPTDEEWYFAAYESGGKERTYPWGEGDPRTGTVNLCGAECAAMLRASKLVLNKEPLPGGVADGYSDTGPVTAFPMDRTPEGILDMGGNVMEWTATSYQGGKARCRGGSWLTSKLSDVSRESVYAIDPKERRANVGFRCVQ